MILACWPPAMPRKFRILLLALVVICVLAMLTVFVLSTGPTPPRPPLPNPNGYDDFLKAAALLNGDIGNASTLNDLRDLVSSNAESLRLLRLGLTRQCALATDAAMTNVSATTSELASLKRLAQLLASEGRLREMDNHLADAAQSYIDAIHLGDEMSRGGFVINRLVGIACEAIGEARLRKLVSSLPPAEARRIVAELEKIDHAGVTWAEVWENEQRFIRYQNRKRFNPITWAVARWKNWRANQQAQMRHKRIAAHLRLLAGELALRACRSEQGRVPARLDDLLTNYLSTVPQDPFAGKPLIYRPQGTNWLLYSVGPDGVDDGGRPVGRSVSGTVQKGDLFYDSPY
jgi:hypothetical protein